MLNFHHLLYEDDTEYSQEEVEDFRNVVYNGVEYSDYKISPCGNVFSKKKNKEWKRLKASCSPSMRYPVIQLEGKTIRIHRLVCEMFYPEIPCPDGIPIDVWSDTHYIVKEFIRNETFEANHKDHNKKNYHPTNLEWVTREGNRNAYKEHLNNSYE